MLKVDRHGATLVLTIDRPAARNALDHATLAALAAALAEARDDPALRAAVLTGAGDVFVSGGDLRELRGRHSAADAERLTDVGSDLTAAIAGLPFPVIAALPGAAIGGGAELAVACDLRVADARAWLAFKQVRMGVTTAWGAAARLAALAGAGAAARLLLAGHELGAAEAAAVGLVDAVTPDGSALETALAWADDVARGAPGAVTAMKRLLRAASADAGLPLLLLRALERQAFVDTWTSPDHVDAVEAFFERRPPRWTPPRQ